MKKIFLLIVLLIVSGCVSYTPVEIEYIRKAQNQETEFIVPVEKTDECWDRGIELISKHVPMKIRTQTESLVETYSATDFPNYSCRINKVRLSKTTKFSVECFNSSGGIQSKQAHIIAYYMLTGEIISASRVMEPMAKHVN